jgi:hypothetical protein
MLTSLDERGRKPRKRGAERPSFARRYETASDDDNRVMSLAAWCDLNGFSLATGRKILDSGDGPPVVQLSDRRVGIRHGDNRRWQDSRIKGA